jgi:hypothetical protein
MNRGQLTLVARLHAEKRSRSEESQTLGATQEAVALAGDSIIQLVLERDSERRMRFAAEVKAQSERHGRDSAMRALQQAMQALRKIKTEASDRERETEEFKALAEAERRAREDAEARAFAEQRAREHAAQELREVRSAAEKQARAFARLESRCRAMAAQLKDLEVALAQAEYVVYRQSLEQTALENAPCARVAAQDQVLTQVRPREESAHGLTGTRPSQIWNKLRRGQR